MQIDEGKLRAYLDYALPPEEAAQVKKQLSDSPEALAALNRLSQERHKLEPYLDGLSPPPGEQSDSEAAWRRFQTQISAQPNPAKTFSTKERMSLMFNQATLKRYQPVLIGLIVIMIVAVALSFAPVRAMAGNLLKMFRVQTVRIVPIDKENAEALRNNPNLEQLVNQLEPQLKVIDKAEPQKVDSVEKAADLVGFRVAEITALPPEVGSPSITVHQEKTIQLQLNKELLEAIFKAAEIPIELPDSINNEPIIVTQPNTVGQKWYKEDKSILEFVQMTAPAVQYPDDLDLNALGMAGLQLLGMSQEEATNLAGSIDWANTLVLPVPRESDVTTAEVSINGNQGFLFTHTAAEEPKAAVIWTKDGMTYFINGNYSPDQMLAMAVSVK